MNKISSLILKMFLLVAFFYFCFSFGLSFAGAYIVQDLNDTEITGNFSLNPSKLEIFLQPGESVEKEITISNRTGKTLEIEIQTEDFGPADFVKAVELLGEEKGVYSLKDYIEPEIRSFVLENGKNAVFSVKIKIPQDSEQKGFYGAVLVAAKNIGEGEGDRVATKVLTRLGTMFFVRVGNGAFENGGLKSFRVKEGRGFLEKFPVEFEILFENNGNVHLTPYGEIEIFDIFGRKAGVEKIDPWFVLPDSLRARFVSWDGGSFSFGRYEARLKLARGYSGLVDEKIYSFWIIPWKMIGIVLVGLLVIIIIAKMMIKRRFNLSKFSALFLFFILLFGLVDFARAYVMGSSNYRIESDSINTGGEDTSSSTSYQLKDTVGEVGTGLSSSASYIMHAGYRQMSEFSISISAPDDIVLSPDISGATGGSGSGSAGWNVKTDNPAGYSLSIKASASPALSSVSDSFADYTPSGADPDFNWSVVATDSEFGFSPEGNDIPQKYKDDGSSCNSGLNDTADKCWYYLLTSDETVAQSVFANYPSGSTTTVKFLAEAGASRAQTAGIYTAMITMTALAL